MKSENTITKYFLPENWYYFFITPRHLVDTEDFTAQEIKAIEKWLRSRKPGKCINYSGIVTGRDQNVCDHDESYLGRIREYTFLKKPSLLARLKKAMKQMFCNHARPPYDDPFGFGPAYVRCPKCNKEIKVEKPWTLKTPH